MAQPTDLRESPLAGGLVPRQFRVQSTRRESADTATLWLEPLDGVPLAFDAGQFTMIGMPGYGEVPISISGDARDPALLQHTIRAVGDATRALTSAERGEIALVRGPFGVGWAPEDARGGDVLVVAGGIGLAPLRPVVLELLANRARYERVVVIYGSRTPDQLLFTDELESWTARSDADVLVTVDAASPTWQGRVGMVTTLLKAAAWDPRTAHTFVCGPEIMMRLTAEALTTVGVLPDRIKLSVERNMKCGVGLCGHCQLREHFVCTDGPVFGYDALAPLLRVREL